jgi:hypothetical protein
MRWWTRLGPVALAMAAAVSTLPSQAGAAPAADAPRRVNYHCTLAATDLGARIRVGYRLTSDGPGQRWHVRLWDGTVRFLSEDVKADAGGAFKVVASTVDYRGVDHLRGSARQRSSGRTCAVAIDG